MKKLLLAMLFAALAASSHAAEIRVGIIGLDTSHVTAFTELLNNPAWPATPPIIAARSS